MGGELLAPWRLADGVEQGIDVERHRGMQEDRMFQTLPVHVQYVDVYSSAVQRSRSAVCGCWWE